MRIRYQPHNGARTVTARGFLGDPLGMWTAGDERDIPDDQRIDYRTYEGGPIERILAVDAVFDLGADFVDAATGINPDFACHVCGKESLAERFPDALGVWHAYEDDGEHRLCILHYLAIHPEFIELHRVNGLDEAVLTEARALAAAPPAAPATATAPPNVIAGSIRMTGGPQPTAPAAPPVLLPETAVQAPAPAPKEG